MNLLINETYAYCVSFKCHDIFKDLFWPLVLSQLAREEREIGSSREEREKRDRSREDVVDIYLSISLSLLSIGISIDNNLSLSSLSLSPSLSLSLPPHTHTHTHTHTVGVMSRCLHESILLDLLYEVMACVPGSLCMTVHHHREKESSPEITNPPLMHKVSAHPQNYPPFCPEPPCELC